MDDDNLQDMAGRLSALAGRVNIPPYDARFLRKVARVLASGTLTHPPKDEPARVIIESPYAGDIKRNTVYARRAMVDSFRRGEAPFASHLLYTQVFDDSVPGLRRLGIEAGLVWGRAAVRSAVYDDYEISGGMHEGIDRAKTENRPVVRRAIGENK